MSYPWLRLWVDMPNDPKWRTIAKNSGRTISEVLAVYLHILVDAANATERGRTQANTSFEDIASALDMDAFDVKLILDSMQSKVLDGDNVMGWDKRQPQRENGASERAKAWREAKKLEDSTDRTQTNTNEHKRTLDKNRLDKNRDKAVSDFDVFWDAFPRKVAKKAAQSAWLKALKEAQAETIIEGARRYFKDPNRVDQFTVHPATWLNQGRWGDDALPSRAIVSEARITAPTWVPPRYEQEERIDAVPMPEGLRDLLHR